MAEWFRALKRRHRLARAVREIETRRVAPRPPHALPGPLVVSLTSYPARYATLDLTLDWYDVEITSLIAEDAVDSILRDCYISNGASRCAGVVRIRARTSSPTCSSG